MTSQSQKMAFTNFFVCCQREEEKTEGKLESENQTLNFFSIMSLNPQLAKELFYSRPFGGQIKPQTLEQQYEPHWEVWGDCIIS